MKKQTSLLHLTFILIVGASFLLIGCSNKTEATPTIDPVMIQTQAVATFSAGLTQTAQALPTATATMTSSPSPTTTSTPSATPTTAVVILPTSSCNVLTFVSDVTIPDNSSMVPGQEFTKTWRVKNTGDCDWKEDFQIKFFSGNTLDGKTLTLGKTIKPGNETNISINLTAPTNTGVYTGNWRMTDNSGSFFGDSFYVMIKVVDGPTLTATVPAPSQTPSPEPSITETPGS